MPLFDTQIARKPNHYPWTQDFIDAMWNGFWTPNEFDFASDYAQFRGELTDHEREIITRDIVTIGQVEVAVKTYWARLGDVFPHPSMSDLGFVLANTEVIHGLAYEKLLDRLHLTHLFEEYLKTPSLNARVSYLRKYLEKVYEVRGAKENIDAKRKQYIYSLILFTLFVENVSLFSQFYVLRWFYRFKNVLKDTAQQVSYTRNEEGIHSQVGIKIIQTLQQEYPHLFDDELKNRIISECRDAFSAESNVIDWIMDGYTNTIKGNELSSDVLKAYIQNRFDESLDAIGYGKPFAAEIDRKALAHTTWMDEELYGNNVADFFHSKPVDYSKSDKTYDAEEWF